MIKEVNIVLQPFSVIVPINYKVTLSVRAESDRPDSVLKYQWFSGEENEIHGATKADLTVKAQKTQDYVCRVNDQFCNCTFSDWVKVKVLNIDRSAINSGSALPVAWQGEPYIIVQPKSQTVTQGERLSLHCYAFGIPTPHFQWYRNGQQLPGSNSNMLQLECSSADHWGTFLCSVSNVLEEIWTDPAEVCMVPTEEHRSPTLTATDKVALLIGNLNYSHHPYLMAPTMDVHELGNLLQQLGFRVVSLLDLTRDEMLAAIDKFIQLLDKGVYALFYYAGHGYEHSGRNYLVAIDAPQPYQNENCVCVQKVMGSMQQKHSALSVILLDTCRKWYNQDHLVSQIMPLEPRGNTVYGYGTCEDAEAFEVQDGGKSTGIFTKYLNKHILLPQKVTHVLEQVSEDLGRDPLVTGKQAVEIKHTLKEPRSLADPMRAAGHTRELLQRDACWRQANELPHQKVIPFTCGAKVNVSFSALFSNVMVVFAKVKATGLTAQDCTIVLRSIPTMEDIFSGPRGSNEMDSLLLNNSDNPDSSIRLCGLQKLQGSLVIKVDLHYTHADSKLRLRESHELDIGRPLVASCKLYKKKPTEAVKRTESAPAQSLNFSNHTQPLQNQPLGRPFTRKAVCTAKVTASRSNQPEENDENEHQYFTC